MSPGCLALAEMGWYASCCVAEEPGDRRDRKEQRGWEPKPECPAGVEDGVAGPLKCSLERQLSLQQFALLSLLLNCIRPLGLPQQNTTRWGLQQHLEVSSPGSRCGLGRCLLSLCPWPAEGPPSGSLFTWLSCCACSGVSLCPDLLL